MASVSINTIPDEILQEILASALIVPDEDFTSIDYLSPFAHILVSSSEILLINKRWLCVATPLLYECIVLRTTPQAQALHNTLRGKSGPQLKRFVSRVRLEAGFGAFTDKLFTALPGITDLFLKSPSSSDEIVTGLTKGLHKLSPTRVIFEFSLYSIWKNTELMSEALCKALRTWKTLNTFKLHFKMSHGYRHGERRLTSLAEALSVAPYLQFAILSISGEGGLSLVVEAVKKIGTNNSLQSIHLLLSSQQMLEQVLDGLIGYSCANIVQCSITSTLSTEMTPYDRGIAVQVPQLPDKIIKRILDIHLRSFLSHIFVESAISQIIDYKRRCINLMLVSKRFHRIVYSMPFRYITISSRDLPLLSSRLSKATSHRYSVEAVILPSIPSVNFLPDDENSRGAIIDLLSCLPRICEISISYHNIDILNRMSENFKLGLRLLELRASSGVLFHRGAIAQFSNLTSLILTWVSIEPVSPSSNSGICFPSVKFIQINDSLNCGILRLIEACDFPSAQLLKMELADLLNPQPKVSEPIIMPTFAELKYIELHGSARGIYAQLMQAERDMVEKIVISSRYHSLPDCKIQKKENEYIIETIEAIDFTKFSALKELQISSVDEWPYKDQELMNSGWQSHAQSLTSTYGIIITNASGFPWKRRMQKLKKVKPQ